MSVFGLIKFIPASIREFIAPVTVRFVDTDALLATMYAMESVLDRPWIERNEDADAIAMKMQKLIGRELLRRGVRFWMEM